MPRWAIFVRRSAMTAILGLEQAISLPPVIPTLSAYLGGLTCLAIDKPTDVVIGKALRDAPCEHTL